MGPSSEPRRAWSGSAFTAEVHRDGRLGLLERGTEADVPPDLTEVARSMWTTDLTRFAFFWAPDGATTRCRVTVERHDVGGRDHVTLSGEAVEELPARLSDRELEVLTLVVAGLGNAEIAAELWITERTTATHVNHILRKLNVSTRTAAATFALDHGVLQVPLPGAAHHYANLSFGRLFACLCPSHGPGRPVLTFSTAPLRPRARQRELVVGAVVPHHGKGSDDGREMRNGLQLAVEEINAAGGIRGRSVRTVVVDADVTSSASVAPAFEAALRDGADVLTSGYLAAQDAAHEIAGRSGVPYLHAATSGVMEQAVQSDPNRFGAVFQMCASDTTYGPAFVSYMTSLRDSGQWRSPSSRLVMLQKGWQHVNFGVKDAEALAAAQGWHLDSVPVGGPEDGDGWQRAVTEALRSPAAAIMIGSYFVDDAVQVVEALRSAQAPTLAYAIYAPSVPSFRHRLGTLAEGVVWATMTGTYADASGIAFARRYKNRFGVNPGRSHAGIAYDRMHRIALAWRVADDLSDSAELSSHLRTLPYRGVNGVYNFDTPGQAAQGFVGDAGDPSLGQPQLIYQIQDGRQVIVDGGPFRTGEFVIPEHLRAVPS